MFQHCVLQQQLVGNFDKRTEPETIISLEEQIPKSLGFISHVSHSE